MNNFKAGDLVYIPSEVVIFNDTNTYKLPAPINLLITGEEKGCYEIFFENKKWLVKRNHVYEAK
jgi:hypothetical protein